MSDNLYTDSDDNIEEGYVIIDNATTNFGHEGINKPQKAVSSGVTDQNRKSLYSFLANIDIKSSSSKPSKNKDLSASIPKDNSVLKTTPEYVPFKESDISIEHINEIVESFNPYMSEPVDFNLIKDHELFYRQLLWCVLQGPVGLSTLTSFTGSKESRIRDNFEGGNVTVRQWRATCQLMKDKLKREKIDIHCKMMTELQDYFPNEYYPLRRKIVPRKENPCIRDLARSHYQRN